jgi:predicted PurR-regulated permease PerM
MAASPRLPPDLPAAAVRGVLVLAAVAAGALVVYRLADVILLLFGAVLVAVLFHAIAGPIRERTRLPRTPSLVAAVLLVVAFFGFIVWLFGYEAQAQVENLSDLLPRAWTEFQAKLSGSPLGHYLLEGVNGASPGKLLVAWAPRFATTAIGAIASTIIVFFAGLYLAFHPETYLGGALLLAPRRARPRLGQIAEACGEALRRWLLGQVFSMLLIGVTVSLGLWAVGVPSPLALGALAGLAQFVPVVGPMAATIPGLLIAASESWQTLAWAGLVYFLASQLEANLFTPFVLRSLAELPMAVTLFAVFAMGVLFGSLGVLFATPLALIAYVVVRMAYVEDVLGERLRGD